LQSAVFFYLTVNAETYDEEKREDALNAAKIIDSESSRILAQISSTITRNNELMIVDNIVACASIGTERREEHEQLGSVLIQGTG